MMKAGTTFFRFVINHAFDRQTDRVWLDRECMERGKRRHTPWGKTDNKLWHKTGSHNVVKAQVAIHDILRQRQTCCRRKGSPNRRKAPFCHHLN